jgi:hypothetical protein
MQAMLFGKFMGYIKGVTNAISSLAVFTLKSLIAMLFVAAGLVGCASPQGATTPVAAMFSLVSTPDGKMYRMNTTTGETWLVLGEKMQKVAQSNAMALEVGRKYFIERSRSITYLGDGRFSEPIPDFSALWN